MLPLANQAGALAQSRILDRTQKGQFLGGAAQNKGYSSNPIMAWKLGKTTWNGANGTLRIKKPLVAPVIIDESELRWGKRGAVLLGGYRRFRQLAGLNSGKVDLSFTGRMLNSLQFKTRSLSNSYRITLSTSRSQSVKAFYTNQAREWLGLSAREIQIVQNFIVQKLDRELNI